MRTLVLVLSLLGLATAAYAAALQQEILVLTTATQITRNSDSRGFELENNGPNAITCAVGSGASSVTVNHGRVIPANGGTWSADIPGVVPLYCIAATASQISGAATIYTEAP